MLTFVSAYYATKNYCNTFITFLWDDDMKLLFYFHTLASAF